MKNSSNEHCQNAGMTVMVNESPYSGKDEQNYETILDEARTRLERDELPPCAFITTSSSIAYLPVQFRTDEEKRTAYDGISDIAGQENARSVMLVNDIWLSSPGFDGQPSEDPNRREALLVLVVNPQGQVVKSTMHPYTRLNGKIVWGTEVVSPQISHQSLLKGWAGSQAPVTDRKLGEEIETVSAAHMATNQSVLDVFHRYPTTRHRVQQLLKEGKNVVVVIGDHVVAFDTYEHTTDPKQAAMTLQDQLVQQSGVPLAIGPDGFPRFTFLAWTATDRIEAPSEVAVVSVRDVSNAKGLAEMMEAFAVRGIRVGEA
jgi:hypothetical protein